MMIRTVLLGVSVPVICLASHGFSSAQYPKIRNILMFDSCLSVVLLRLTLFRNITMEPRMLQRIWTPNTCLINSKRTMIHASPSENVMLILYEVCKKSFSFRGSPPFKTPLNFGQSTSTSALRRNWKRSPTISLITVRKLRGWGIIHIALPKCFLLN